MAAELARPDVAARRVKWLKRRQPRMRREPGRLVFRDETSVNTTMTRIRGRARRGQRLRARAPYAKWGHRPSSPGCVPTAWWHPG